MQCEMSRSAGYDPTGEWAVECGAEGEYCDVCEIVVCSHCHKAAMADTKHQQRKKLPLPASLISRQSRTGT